MSNYYQLLGIEKTATPQEIKKAYFSKIKIHSPEKDPIVFQQIRQAYDVLKDTNERKIYDQGFESEDDYQEEFIKANEYLRQENHSKALQILKNLNKEFPNRSPIELALAKAYRENGNTGNSIKLLEKLYKENPLDKDISLQLAITYGRREYCDKARMQFERTLLLDKTYNDVWIAYADFALSNFRNSFNAPYIFQRAFEVNKNMFINDFHLLVLFVGVLLDYEEIEEICLHINKLIDAYPNANINNASKYKIAVALFAKISSFDKTGSTIKVLDSLKNSPFKTSETEEILKVISFNIDIIKLDEDKDIDEVFTHLTFLLRKKCNCKNCTIEKFEMESYIIDKAKELSKSLFILKERYVEFYVLNERFYEKVLNPNKLNELKNQYSKKFMVLSRKYPGAFSRNQKNPTLPINEEKQLSLWEEDFTIEDDDFDDFFATQEPYVREEPKVGRNDPCPCGSGKKYKKCCGS